LGQRRGRAVGGRLNVIPNGVWGVHGLKTPPPPPSILFSGSPTHANPKLRRKGTKKGKEKAIEGDWDVEVLGDESQLRKNDIT
jgi:hypothetical protein